MSPSSPTRLPMRVGVLGYLAVLERLSLPVSRADVGSGSTGTRLPITLTADVPLVALALTSLAESSNHNSPPWVVDACINHPGNSPQALASLNFLNTRTQQLIKGQHHGTPLEWQVLHADGEITWFSDPQCAVDSLRHMPRINWVQQEWDHLYLDGYAWLTEAIAQHLPIEVPHVWLNLGVVAFDSLAPTIRTWRNAVFGQLHVQVSTAGKADLLEAQNWAFTAIQAGADMAIITCAEKGLVLASASEVVTQSALPVDYWVDASGAGAAVSCALIAAALQAQISGLSPPHLSHMALVAAQAGRLQCMQHGALDARSQFLWEQTLANTHGELKPNA